MMKASKIRLTANKYLSFLMRFILRERADVKLILDVYWIEKGINLKKLFLGKVHE